MDFRSPMVILILISITVTDVLSVDFTSPLVFDVNFYFNTNRHAMHGIHTKAAAKAHWLAHGIDAGLQGIGSFHSKQYIERYPDLKAAFHSNYRAAIQHYLNHIQTEHRHGVLHQYQTRWSIYANGITIGASQRMGGAIDSLTWNNKELVNCYDHGREIQMACNSDTYTECYNPTEAGGRDDASLETTHTHIKWIRANDNVLESEVYPAFWLRPGSHEKRSACLKGSSALNNQATYAFPFHKKVTIGSHGIQNCIQFISNFTLGGDWPLDLRHIQMEAPAIYLMGDLNQIYNFNANISLVQPYHTNRLPTILSSADHQYAMGVYSPPGQPSDAFMYYTATNFHITRDFSTTTKIGVVYRKVRFQGSGPTNQVYTSYICVGTLNDVSNCMHKIMMAVPRV